VLATGGRYFRNRRHLLISQLLAPDLPRMESPGVSGLHDRYMAVMWARTRLQDGESLHTAGSAVYKSTVWDIS